MEMITLFRQTTYQKRNKKAQVVKNRKIILVGYVNQVIFHIITTNRVQYGAGMVPVSVS